MIWMALLHSVSALSSNLNCGAIQEAAKIFDGERLLRNETGTIGRQAEFSFATRNGQIIKVFFYRASNFDPVEGEIVFALHGSSRTARGYIRKFSALAERNDALILAPKFDKERFGPGSDAYTLAVGSRGRPYTGEYREDEWLAPEDFLYFEIERLFDGVRALLGSSVCRYRIWGHSAGAQFVHRLLTFLPEARVASAVAANAGFYTMPSFGVDHDPNYFLPYGLQGTSLSSSDLQTLLQQPLSILVGQLDIESPDVLEDLRGSRQAMAQGSNRLERAFRYFESGLNEAARLKSSSRWRYGEVPKTGHDTARMAPSIAWFLFSSPDDVPCRPTGAHQARGLTISELLIDPPPGLAGDANGDGIRHAEEDEFIEFYNHGNSSICLANWSLMDSDKKTRHVFPLGTELKPGETLVVFGGGLPTGSFGGAIVQTAVHWGELDLTDSSDRIELVDGLGVTARSLSWGDRDGTGCDSQSCIMGDVRIDQSFVRRIFPDGEFAPSRSSDSGLLYSPGLVKEAQSL